MSPECKGGLYEDNILARDIWSNFFGRQEVKEKKKIEPAKAFHQEIHTLHEKGGAHRKERKSILSRASQE